MLHVTARLRGTETRLAGLRQEGCLRACFPHSGAGPLQVVTLNTSGGMTDGDGLQTRLAVEAGAFMVVASQAAERVYRARPGASPARVSVRAEVARHGRLEYLPQETILFDGCALDRHLTVEMDPDSTYLGVESLVFGRAASGEVLGSIRLRDRVSVRRGGRLVLHDGVILQGPAAAILAGPATGAGAGAVASLVYAAPDAEVCLAPLRDSLAGEGLACGASFSRRHAGGEDRGTERGAGASGGAGRACRAARQKCLAAGLDLLKSGGVLIGAERLACI